MPILTDRNGTIIPCDSRGRIRQDYLQRLESMADEELTTETRNILWLIANMGGRSKHIYGWQKELCVREWQKRNKQEQYYQIYREVNR